MLFLFQRQDEHFSSLLRLVKKDIFYYSYKDEINVLSYHSEKLIRLDTNHDTSNEIFRKCEGKIQFLFVNDEWFQKVVTILYWLPSYGEQLEGTICQNFLQRSCQDPSKLRFISLSPYNQYYSNNLYCFNIKLSDDRHYYIVHGVLDMLLSVERLKQIVDKLYLQAEGYKLHFL